METVICPNCGSLISIPKTMPVSVTCKKCSESFGVEYDYAEVGFFWKNQDEIQRFFGKTS